MSLTLGIENIARLDNGAPLELVLHRRGAIIGRSPTCDWCLPDARNFISSRHIEISWSEGQYWLTDTSTNGTFVNGATDRMAGPHRLSTGDRILVGDYQIVATLSGEAAALVEADRLAAAQAAQAGGGNPWDGWTPPPVAAPEQGFSGMAGGPPTIAPPPFGESWTPNARAPDAHAGPSVWDGNQAPVQGASGWSSAAPDRPADATPDDIWGKLADNHVVDWARGGFGQTAKAAGDPLGLDKGDAWRPRGDADGWGPAGSGGQGGGLDSLGLGPSGPTAAAALSPPPPPAPAPAAAAAVPLPDPAAFAGARGAVPAMTAPPMANPQPAAPPPPAGAQLPSGEGAIPLLAAAGLQPGQVGDTGDATLARAGELLHQLVAGLVLMVEARARAKAQMGAEVTSFSFDGNNPIKFARSPEQAVAQLLNPPERGFMEAGRAIEDAYRDLQSHQMATLKAMQGALRATLDRFSPTAIKGRVGTGGIMKMLPGARDAALWQAYEREFSGVAQGSDEAFMEVFAAEFRKAYEEQSRR